jgi:hypothetical protein
MQKILYLTETDWFWSKQRPQFLAEGLSEYFHVTYVFHKTYHVENIVAEHLDILPNLKLRRLYRMPFNRFLLIRLINKFLTVIQLFHRISEYDIIWITHPDVFGQTRVILPHGKTVVYDCMDNHPEFPMVKNRSSRLQAILKNEEDLIKRSDHILVSSEYLKQKLEQRYTIEKKLTVINNALSGAIFKYDPRGMEKQLNDKKYDGHYKLIYTGTISEWFDFELITQSLKRFENIIYFLIGPRETEIPDHDRIVYVGPVAHENLISAFYYADALIMPFISNDLVLSINPVKLYEYIFSGRPSFIPVFPETERFNDFIFTYSTPDDYFSLIEELVQNRLVRRKSVAECESFAKENTWDNRIEKIIKLLRITAGTMQVNRL